MLMSDRVEMEVEAKRLEGVFLKMNVQKGGLSRELNNFEQI